MYWLGIDVGTGGTRALLVNETGEVAGGFTAPHQDIRMDRPQWAEQDPEDWWEASLAAVRGVLAETGVSAEAVSGIGLSGQMHGLVLLDSSDRVIRPALIWCDQRSQAQVDEVNRQLTREAVLRYTANPVITGFTLPKLLWVRDHQPELFARVRRVLLPKDYIRFRLTGEYASDVSDASGTAMFDVVRRRWSADLMRALGLDESILPRVYESSEVSGKLSAAAAGQTGLAPGIPVAAGAGDQAASAAGNGIVERGIASCTLGTSGVVFVHMDEPAYDPGGRVHTFCHAVSNKWHVMGVTQGAGLSLQWFRNRLAPGEEYSQLSAEAASVPPGADGLFWLPYLMGERTPHLDAEARAAWIGLTARHTRPHLVRSILEGVCFSQKDGLDIIEGMGVEVSAVRMSGGGARSVLWRQLMADILNKPIVTLATQEGSAYGAALLAMTATGRFSSVPEACRATIREAATVEPRPDIAAQYRELHSRYQTLYPLLSGRR